MRKVTVDAVNAMRNGINYKSGSTRVASLGNLSSLYLNDNLIARLERDNGSLWLSDAGIQSITTKDRLNGLLQAYSDNFIINTRKGCWVLQQHGENERMGKGIIREQLWHGTRSFFNRQPQ